MSDSFKSYYFPAKCHKCGDVTKVLRSPLMTSRRVGNCGLRVGNRRCDGPVYFFDEPHVPKPVGKPLTVVGGNPMGDLLDRTTRPYSVAREGDVLEPSRSDQEMRESLDANLSPQDSWGMEEELA